MTDMTCTVRQLIDDDRTRVTRFTIAPGQQTGRHRHRFNSEITALTDCYRRLEHPDGTVTETTVQVVAAYRRGTGVAHNVLNAGPAGILFMGVELA